jgi:hypothetical protein
MQTVSGPVFGRRLGEPRHAGTLRRHDCFLSAFALRIALPTADADWACAKSWLSPRAASDRAGDRIAAPVNAFLIFGRGFPRCFPH